jgi:molybdopterin-guanine dinucleotide biosynthesis protein
MAIVVIGGHSRNVGKTSVVAGLISALPEYKWLAIKITQDGHGLCNDASCDGTTDAVEHGWAVTQERDRSGKSDTSRFLAAGAVNALLVSTRQGMLAQAMPMLQERIAHLLTQEAEHIIIESNSVVRFLRPDLYLSVLDYGTADFKASAREFLDRADAVLLHTEGRELVPNWQNVSAQVFRGKPVFWIRHGGYTPPEVVDFVREKISAVTQLP